MTAKGWVFALGLIMGAGAGQAVAQSGRPEVTVQAPATAIKSQLINEMLNRGFSVVSDSPYLVVFEKVSDNLGAMFLFGTRYGGAPHVRASFSIADLNGSSRVVSDVALIGNAGTAFERRTDLNFGTDAAQAQEMLNLVASRSAPLPQPVPVEAERPMTVLDLARRNADAPLSDVP
jgi:hypothetical protein